MESNEQVWIDNYLNVRNPEIDSEGWDASAVPLPAHPDPAHRTAIVINFPAKNTTMFETRGGGLPAKVLRPSSLLVDREKAQGVWWVADPVRSHHDVEDKATVNLKPYYTWMHVSAVLKNLLEGRQEHTNMVNLFDLAQEPVPLPGVSVAFGPSNAKPMKLREMKYFWLGQGKAEQALFYQNSYDKDEARRLGGSTMTEAQTAARKANLLKGRDAAAQASRKKKIDHAHKVVGLVQAGLGYTEIASALGISESSVGTTINRAKQVVAATESEQAAA